MERFRRETDAAASLEHPNIVPVHEYGERSGLAFLVMPYISGGTLRDEMEQSGQLPLSTISNYLDQIAAALDFAHARGVIHRDIKPANILMTPEKRLLLTDFGLVKVVNDANPQQSQLSEAGMPMGTPDYMAPEQVVGGEINNRADLYSLGVVIYQMLTGTVPFKGEMPMKVALQHVQTPPPAPRLLRSDLPLATQEVVLRALAKRPEDRYAHASDMAAAFRSTLELVAASNNSALESTLLRPARPDNEPAQPVLQRRGLFNPTWRSNVPAPDPIPLEEATAPLAAQYTDIVKQTSMTLPSYSGLLSPSTATATARPATANKETPLPGIAAPTRLRLGQLNGLRTIQPKQVDLPAVQAVEPQELSTATLASSSSTASGGTMSQFNPPSRSFNEEQPAGPNQQQNPGQPASTQHLPPFRKTAQLGPLGSFNPPPAGPATTRQLEPLSPDATGLYPNPDPGTGFYPTNNPDPGTGFYPTNNPNPGTGFYPTNNPNPGTGFYPTNNPNPGTGFYPTNSTGLLANPDGNAQQPSSGTTSALRLPTGDYNGETGMLKLDQAVRVVKVPIAGQPGQYMTGILPMLPPTPEPTPPPFKERVTALPGVVKKNTKMAALIALVALVIFGSVVFLLVHAATSGTTPSQASTLVKVTPNATATVAVQASATASANLILADSLNANINNWPLSDGDAKHSYAFKDNAYHIGTNSSNIGVALLPRNDIPDSYVYTLTMKQVAGDNGNSLNRFGMILRYTKQNGKATFYIFLIQHSSSGGMYIFETYDSSKNDFTWNKLWSKIIW